ncbi:MAG: glycosyltransferase family 4 protein [Porphyrobacter sp.]|nr:glycosyltransferase family 4 protein [Porphyrobacter sp.]
MISQPSALDQPVDAELTGSDLSGAKQGRITVCYPLAGDTIGGSHVSLRGLLDRLDTSRFDILIAPESTSGRLAEHYAGFRQIADPAPPRSSFVAGRRFGLLNFLSTVPAIAKRAQFLKQHQVDIVHTNDGRTHATWALAAKLAGARLVWHHRGDPTARGIRYVAPLLADQILAVSSFALPGGNIGAARTAQVVHSPFDSSMSFDRQASRSRIIEELGLDPDTILCGYFGLFIERKRPLKFIEAVGELARLVDRPVAGVMFGEALDETMLAAMADKIAHLPANTSVALMGYRTPGHEWLAGCDLLLVPAIDEPLGRTLVEAMLVRTPVVATNSGGNPEALAQDCGVLCAGDEPLDMARKARDLLNDRERMTDMVIRARTRAVDHFSEERHVEAIEKVYLRLVE